MAILHRQEHATVAEVQAELADPPGYSSVRKLLEILEKKGEVQHEADGPRYVFSPSTVKTEARRSASRSSSEPSSADPGGATDACPLTQAPRVFVFR